MGHKSGSDFRVFQKNQKIKIQQVIPGLEMLNWAKWFPKSPKT